MTDYMKKAREMSCDEDGELSVFQALGSLRRTLEALDTERTRADKAEAELQAMRSAVRMARLELGSHGACPACINAHTLLTRNVPTIVKGES
jgi:hypothetical protein